MNMVVMNVERKLIFIDSKNENDVCIHSCNRRQGVYSPVSTLFKAKRKGQKGLKGFEGKGINGKGLTFKRLISRFKRLLKRHSYQCGLESKF